MTAANGMRALTVKQPWAWAIIHGGKDIENRTRPFPSTVPLGTRIAIHAGLGRDKAGQEFLLNRWALGGSFSAHDVLIGPMERGAIIGTVEVVESIEPTRRTGSPWANVGTWAWRLANPIPCKPIPCRGALGLWVVPDDVLLELAIPVGDQ